MKERATGPSSTAPPQVYVLDDEAGVVAMLSRLLRRAGYRVATFESPRRFLREAPLTAPCCLLLDVHMPEIDGVEIQAKLAAFEQPPPIVFMSGGADVPTSVRVMKAGAVDFLSKPFENKDLLAAVAAALRLAEQRAHGHAAALEARRQLDLLTPRELEVCQGVARGLKSKEIADELGAAVKTIDVHRSRVMAKLGVTSVAALVKLLDRARGDGG